MPERLSDNANKFFQEVFDAPEKLFPSSQWRTGEQLPDEAAAYGPLKKLYVPHPEHSDQAYKSALVMPTGLSVVQFQQSYRALYMTACRTPAFSGVRTGFEKVVPRRGTIGTAHYYDESGDLQTIQLFCDTEETGEQELAIVSRREIRNVLPPNLGVHVEQIHGDFRLVDPGAKLVLEVDSLWLPANRKRKPDPEYTGVRVLGCYAAKKRPEHILNERIPIVATVEKLRAMVLEAVSETLS